MSKDMDDIANEMKNRSVTITAYEMGEIIATEIHKLMDHEKMAKAGIDNLVLMALFSKVLAMFGAAIMTEMFPDADDGELEIEPNDK